jgi:hypothetical protein
MVSDSGNWLCNISACYVIISVTISDARKGGAKTHEPPEDESEKIMEFPMPRH